VSNTEFEGGGDGHGHGDHTFLVKQAQPSHTGTGGLGSTVITALYSTALLRYTMQVGNSAPVRVAAGGCQLVTAAGLLGVRVG
jgi:hypothetical protein